MNTLNIALAIALSGLALSANATSYTFTDLGILGGSYSGAYGISASPRRSRSASASAPATAAWAGGDARRRGCAQLGAWPAPARAKVPAPASLALTLGQTPKHIGVQMESRFADPAVSRGAMLYLP